MCVGIMRACVRVCIVRVCVRVCVCVYDTMTLATLKKKNR